MKGGGDWPFSSICFLAAAGLGVYFPLFLVSNRARREACTPGYPAVWIIQSLGLAVCTCTVQTHTLIFIAQQQTYASVSVLVSKQCTHSRCTPALTHLHLKTQHIAVVAATQTQNSVHIQYTDFNTIENILVQHWQTWFLKLKTALSGKLPHLKQTSSLALLQHRHCM